jgi:D-alanyl-D-alanine carboxypeptidase
MLLTALCAAVVLPVSLVAPPAAATPPAANPTLQALLDELVANGATGALARLDDGQHTYRLASGAARLEPRQPLTPAARFRVGSITKTFVATVTMQLVGTGTLRLDDTVERWVPGLVPNGDAITLRMLLNHTSGLFNYTDDPTFFDRDPTAPVTPQELVAIATKHPPTFPPGQGWSYSNTGYIVVGLILEAATGQSLDRLVTRQIIHPLHLTGTYFPTRSPYIVGYHAHGYRPPSLTGDGYLDVTAFAPSLAWAAGAIVSTADDLRRFYSALLGGRLLRPALLDQMLTTVRVDPVFGYGFGIYSQRGPCGTVWGHTGGIPGYVSFAFNDRSGRRSVVVMLPTEPDQNLGPLLQLTVDTAICQMFGRVPPATATTSAATETTLPGIVSLRKDFLAR